MTILQEIDYLCLLKKPTKEQIKRIKYFKCYIGLILKHRPNFDYNIIKKYFNRIYCNTYQDCINLFKKNITSKKKYKIRSIAKQRFSNEFNKNDFPKKIKKYNNYQDYINKFNKSKKISNKYYYKLKAKEKFPNEFNENDFLNRRIKYNTYQDCINRYNKTKQDWFIYYTNRRFPNEFNENDFKRLRRVA